MKAIAVTVITGLAVLFGMVTTQTGPIYPRYSPAPAPVSSESSAAVTLLLHAQAPVTVVSVDPVPYRGAKSELLFDIIARDGRGHIYVFAGSSWSGLKSGDIIKPCRIIVGEEP
jgi:hypothetical protein